MVFLVWRASSAASFAEGACLGIPCMTAHRAVTLGGDLGGKHVLVAGGAGAVGHYAIRPTFSDGHDTGIYSWDYLYELGVNQERMWAEYLAALDAAGASREPGAPQNAAFTPGGGASCGHHHRCARHQSLRSHFPAGNFLLRQANQNNQYN